MSTVKPVKTAVIGCGTISRAYLDNMSARFQILDVVACCDIVPQKAAETAEKYHIQALTTEEIKSDPSIEIVVNLTIPTPIMK